MRRSPTCLPHFGHYMACISLCRLLRIQIGHFKQVHTIKYIYNISRNFPSTVQNALFYNVCTEQEVKTRSKLIASQQMKEKQGETYQYRDPQIWVCFGLSLLFGRGKNDVERTHSVMK
ncbi:uncharacterized protein [Drosophila virilis]|uniref:uncharacterized protein isoform X2 n=1 Tax=Drosophila virilis TaxID=7244 RepID=UPI0013961336|nr:uncharacterized protein LOC116649923 isoform X2 [Drosophila virilis]XP_032289098.1 uncharacterized protein LOC116649924 isoform X2 [Drosophila virilis]